MKRYLLDLSGISALHYTKNNLDKEKGDIIDTETVRGTCEVNTGRLVPACNEGGVSAKDEVLKCISFPDFKDFLREGANVLDSFPDLIDFLREGANVLDSFPDLIDFLREGTNVLDSFPDSTDLLREGANVLDSFPDLIDFLREGANVLDSFPDLIDFSQVHLCV
ncbi:hypothetical protein MM300_12380 [Evansella sp. LMS18]|uniref:hypothetical protein n=1 Tax=Evansella sp. LMS18 TaxID=2924033 RepID=UPI0020D1D368|nr:hypothetical protein [Evansella sp. LMS18]UTR08738.1 hypothetical protein MM300_12380 [Evansella sp. LMS18]